MAGRGAQWADEKLFPSALFLLSPVGCASAPLPDTYYDRIAQQLVGAQKCGSSGMMPAETAAPSIRVTQNKLHDYTFDQARLAERLKFSNDVLMMTREDCNSLAIQAMAFKGNSAPVQYAPRTTNCSTYFGQTRCTSF